MTKAEKIKLLKAILRDTFPEQRGWFTFLGLTMEAGNKIDFFAFKRPHRVAILVTPTLEDYVATILNELKISRVQQVATLCYFIAPEGVISPDSLPEGWGLYELTPQATLSPTIAAVQINQNLDVLPLWFASAVIERSSDRGSNLPQGIWLLQGQEVNENDLIMAANAAVVHRAEQQIETAAGRIRHELEKEYAPHKELIRVIHTVLGHQYRDPEALETILREYAKLPPPVVGQLQTLRANIDALIGGGNGG